jgi:hypothetical protein
MTTTTTTTTTTTSNSFFGKRFCIELCGEDYVLQHWHDTVTRNVSNTRQRSVYFGQINLGHKPEGVMCNCGKIDVTSVEKTQDFTDIVETHTRFAPVTPTGKDQYVCARGQTAVIGCYMNALCQACNITFAQMRVKMLAYQKDKGFGDSDQLLYCLWPHDIDNRIIIGVDLLVEILPEFQDKTNIFVFLEQLKTHTMRIFSELQFPNRVRHFLMEGRVNFMHGLYAATFVNQMKEVKRVQSQFAWLQSNYTEMLTNLDEARMQVCRVDSLQRKLLLSMSRLFDEVHFLRECVAHQARGGGGGSDDEMADNDSETQCMCLRTPNSSVLLDMFPERHFVNKVDTFGSHNHSDVCTRHQIATLKRGEPYGVSRPKLERAFLAGADRVKAKDTKKRKRKATSRKTKKKKRKKIKKGKSKATRLCARPCKDSS